MKFKLMLGAISILFLTNITTADTFYKVQAGGGNSCGFWGSGFEESGSTPVFGQGSFFDSTHPATYSYAGLAACGVLDIETELVWSCGCGSLCGENNGTARMDFTNLIITGPPGATTAHFRISLDLSVPTMQAFSGGWRLFATTSISPATIDTGNQSGPLPRTRLVSGMATWNVNTPFPFNVNLTTGIRAVEQAPQARAEAIAEFPNDAPVFSFFDDVGNPVEGFSVAAVAPNCPRGDMNCDQVVNLSDVPGFVAALLNRFPGSFCASPTADTNVDGIVDGLDIDPFITCVLGGPCP